MLSRLPITFAQLKAEIILKNLKMKLDNYCILCTDQKTYKAALYKFGWLYLKMETIFMNTENSKTSQAHRFKLG